MKRDKTGQCPVCKGYHSDCLVKRVEKNNSFDYGAPVTVHWLCSTTGREWPTRKEAFKDLHNTI